LASTTEAVSATVLTYSVVVKPKNLDGERVVMAGWQNANTVKMALLAALMDSRRLCK
jgi:hypothetical protein